MIKKFISKFGKRKFTLLLSLILLLTVTVSSTLAYLFTNSDTLVNTFMSKVLLKRSVTITKTVEADAEVLGSQYSELEGKKDKEFTFEVTLSGYTDKKITMSGSDYGYQIGEEKKYPGEGGKATETLTGTETITIFLKDKGSVTFEKLEIGTVVTAEEILGEEDKAAYTVLGTYKRTHIVDEEAYTMDYINHYSPGRVNPVNLTLVGEKRMDGAHTWNRDDRITFELQYKKPSSTADDEWIPVSSQTIGMIYVQETDGTGNVTERLTNPDTYYKFDFTEALCNIAFEKAGEYPFRIIEKESNIDLVTYNDSNMYFDVIVGDVDEDPNLDIVDIRNAMSSGSFTPATNGLAVNDAEERKTEKYWVVRSEATDKENGFDIYAKLWNHYAQESADEVSIEIKKTIADETGSNLTLAGYTFELYDHRTGELVTTSHATTAAGETSIKLVVQSGGEDHYVLKETNCGETIKGMQYDDSVYRVAVIKDIVATNTYEGTIMGIEENDFILLGGFGETSDDEEEETDPTEESESGESETEATEGSNSGSGHNIAKPSGSTEKTEGIGDTQPSQGGEETKPTEEKKIAKPSGDKEETQATEGEKTPSSASAVLTILSQTIEEEEEENTKVFTVYFENTYTPKPAVLSLAGTKTVIYGNQPYYAMDKMEGKFTFLLFEDVEGKTVDQILATETPIMTASNKADGTFAFRYTSDMTEVKLDKVGTYRYLVCEHIPAENDRVPGIKKYDDTIYWITVVVQPNADTGDLEASYSYETTDGKKADAISFENQYSLMAAISKPIVGTKTVDGTNYTGNEFTFLLYECNNASYDPTDDPDPEVVRVVENGQFQWNRNYRADQLANGKKVFYYYVEEASSYGNNYAEDKTIFTITDTLLDDGMGNLVVDRKFTYRNGVLRGGDTDKLIFANKTIQAAASSPISGTKKLDGKLSEKVFTFDILKTDSNFSNEVLYEQVKNGTDGKFVIGGFTYTADQLDEHGVGTFYYKVVENTDAAEKTIEYDTSTYYTIIHNVSEIADSAAGAKLEVDTIIRKYVDGKDCGIVEEIEFVNTTKEIEDTSEPTTKPTTEPTSEPTTETTEDETTKPTKPSSSADTGDRSNIWLYVALLALSGFVLLLVLFLGRRKKTKGGRKRGKYE